jgi:hypothetical protein
MAYLQVSPLEDSLHKTWRGQGIGRRSVSWNFPKLSQLWRCSEDFGPSTTQNHLQTKQLLSDTTNSSRVSACELRNEQAETVPVTDVNKILGNLITMFNIDAEEFCQYTSQGQSLLEWIPKTAGFWDSLWWGCGSTQTYERPIVKYSKRCDCF